VVSFENLNFLEKIVSKNSFFMDLAIAGLMASALACASITGLLQGNSSTGNGEHYEEEHPGEDGNELNTPAGQLCPRTLSLILSNATRIENKYKDTGEQKETVNLVTYVVTGDQISTPHFENVSGSLRSYQDDITEHQEIWDTFITLIPIKAREPILAEYSLMTDGAGNNLAVVTQTSTNPSRWVLSVDIADADKMLNLTYTFIHEFAHLLTLGPNQVTPSLAIFENPDDENVYFNEAAACPYYFPGEGCSHPDSYLNAFFTQFWANIHEEWQGINLIEDDEIYYGALDKFYDDHHDSFLTVYAATNPEEDIAESFTFFILSPLPTGESIAEQKILFFYGYPELVSLRDQIIDGICRLGQ